MYNNAQVKEIFDREAIMIGTSDGVPYYKVVELFGKAAADYAIKHCMGKGSGNVRRLGDFYLSYFTFSGLQIAATYANIVEIRDNVVKDRDCNGQGDNEN